MGGPFGFGPQHHDQGNPWRHHPRPGDRGPWGQGGRGARGTGGPPPWVAGLFGLAQGMQQRGPKVRRGDVRAAVLDVLREGPRNGYQVIQQIEERSGGAWRPSPGSVYPTVSQLEDEGLVAADAAEGRRTLRLTADGEAYVAEHPDELEAVWTPFDTPEDADDPGDYANLKPEIGALMNAVWQIVSTGTDQQRREAVQLLTETRRRLYGLLAEGEAE
ncbi:PadR family transcriptional regulator [Nocardioides sp.]|uniref:PadR family transcriptional regulator n=1 Tax=Nocardioides sp. TaxID=35761 RepID=UPI003528EA62